MKMKILARVAVLTAAASLVACGGGGGNSDSPAPPPASGSPSPAPAPSPSPAPAPAEQTIVRVHAGSGVLYALTEAGELLATGEGHRCVIGDGTVQNRDAPVSLGMGWTHVVGASPVFALRQDGGLYGWGTQIGDGTTRTRCEPTLVGTGYRTVYTHQDDGGAPTATIAIKQDGTLWVWNDPELAPLSPLTPVQIGGDTDWVAAVSSSVGHYLALKDNGSLWAFGSNNYGQQGLGVIEGYRHVNWWTPRLVDVGPFRSVAAEGATSYAITASGDLYAWGRNGGRFGDNSSTDRALPTFVGSSYASIHPARFRTIALRDDGSVWAWGDNGLGHPVGDGTQVPRFAPVQVMSGATWLSNTSAHALALDQQGRTWGWANYDYRVNPITLELGFAFSEVPVMFDFFAPRQQ